MSSQCNLVMLAGSSEAGKSSAGQFFSQSGAIRQKIRGIILPLTSGHVVTHEGVRTREGFDASEFIMNLLAIRAGLSASDILVVESFIDPSLAEQCRNAWPGRALIVFIDAPLELRVSRLIAATGLADAKARGIIMTKDRRKRLDEQLPIWKSLADVWINNTGPPEDYLLELRQIIDLLDGND